MQGPAYVLRSYQRQHSDKQNITSNHMSYILFSKFNISKRHMKIKPSLKHYIYVIFLCYVKKKLNKPMLLIRTDFVSDHYECLLPINFIYALTRVCVARIQFDGAFKKSESLLLVDDGRCAHSLTQRESI